MNDMPGQLDAIRARLDALDVRTAAFLCCLDVKMKRPYGGCETYLRRQAVRLQERDDFLESAFWLWALGEYAGASGGTDALREYAAAARKAVAVIGREWNRPHPHWLVPDGRAVWLGNLAIAAGGLRAASLHLQDEEAGRLLREIREFVFAEMMHQGGVVGALGSREITGDIGIAAVPFGLFNAGDLVLVAAVDWLEAHLANGGVRFSIHDTRYGGCVRPDLTALLAWYYSERGHLARAAKLLDSVRRQWERDGKLIEYDIESAIVPLYARYDLETSGPPRENELAYILYEIARLNLEQKSASGAAGGGELKIVHRPAGSRSPYIAEAAERFPRDPEEGDAVTVSVRIEPHRPAQQAAVQLAVDGEDWDGAATIPMEPGVSEDGIPVWRAELGRFAFGSRVSYRIVASDEQTTAVSEPYTFRVRGWRALEPASLRRREGGAELIFRPLDGSGASPRIAFSVLNGRSVRCVFDVGGEAEAADDPVRDGEVAVGSYRLRVDAGTGHLELRDAQGRIVAQTYDHGGTAPFEALTDGDGGVHKLRLNLRMAPDERMYGTGERYADLEFAGRNVDHYVFNQYRGQGMRTYIPVPLAISSKGYGLYLHTGMYAVFRFGTRVGDRFEAEADVRPDRPRTEWHLFPGAPSDVLEAYTDVTGKPALPPKWAFGPWMSSNNWDSQAVTMEQVEQTVRHRIPATVLVLEQWSDEATFYIFNDCQYEPKPGLDAHRYEEFRFPEWGRWPDPKRMVEEIHAHGIRVLLWQIPVIKFMEGLPHAQRDEDEMTALEHGLVVRRADGEPYRIPPYEWFKDSLVADFTNPLTRKWWFDKRRYLIEEIGVDGFKTDGGECIYGDVVFHDGRSGLEMRNLYPNEYIGAYYDFARELTGGDAVTFSRAGYAGAQNYPLHWAGDERSTFEAFRSSVIAGLTSGMSGLPFWGWDLAGFHGDIPTAELYVRSAQMAAFCPVMQYHAESKGEFNQDRTPWNVAERTGKPWVLTLYKRYADLRMNLLPYIYDQAVRTSRTGIPLMRAMAFAYPDDPRCARLKEQYMFGDALLVAPVVEEGRTVKDVYLPEGDWLPLFGGEAMEGGRMVRVPAAIADIPVYQRQDSAVAWNLPEDYALPGDVGNRVDGYVNLTFNLFVRERLDETFEDDLGSRVRIQAERTPDGLHVRLDGRCAAPAVTIVVRDVPGVRSVTDGASRDLRRVEVPHVLQPGGYAVQGGDLYIKTDECASEWRIHFAS